MKTNFKIGDRIIVKEVGRFDVIQKGDTGTVICFNDKFNSIGVRFDTYYKKKHDCDGHCEDGYGWFINEKKSIKYTSEKELNKLKIIYCIL